MDEPGKQSLSVPDRINWLCRCSIFDRGLDKFPRHRCTTKLGPRVREESVPPVAGTTALSSSRTRGPNFLSVATKKMAAEAAIKNRPAKGCGDTSNPRLK
jgi:hypothetical protein